MLDFDNIDEWAPTFAVALRRHVTESVVSRLIAAKPEYVEDAAKQLLSLAGCDAVIDATLELIRSETVVGYHGSRLTGAEVASIETTGLVPLKAENRRHRLVGALSRHSQ